MAEIDLEAFVAEVNHHPVHDIRAALLGLNAHPLRGPAKSHELAVDSGRVRGGKPEQGFRVRHFGGEYHVDLIEVSHGVYVHEVVSMPERSFPGFVNALLDALRQRP